MIERVKILAAALRLRDGTFTVKDLSEAAVAKPATVRTVVDRAPQWFEPLDTRQATGRPGGQWQVYKLRPHAENEIKVEIERLHAAGETVHMASADRLPPALLVAEDLLLTTPRAKLREVLPWVQSLTDEVALLQEYNFEGNCYDSALLQVHIRFVDFLSAFAKEPHCHPLHDDKVGVRFIQIMLDLAKDPLDDPILGRTLRSISQNETTESAVTDTEHQFERSSPAAMSHEAKEASFRQFEERLESQGKKTLEGDLSLLMGVHSFG